MNLQDQPLSAPLLPPPKPRIPIMIINKVRAWLRALTGRVVFPLITLLIGILIGFVSLLFVAIGADGQLHVVPKTPAMGNIIVEADKTFLTQLVTKNLQTSGMPGSAKNVQVTLVHGDKMTITADDEFNVLGISVTRNFTLVVQPYVSGCVLQMHVVHADLGSIPITGFVQAFENSINEQLRMKPTGLPTGFVYCTVGVRTEPEGMFVIYSAIPV